MDLLFADSETTIQTILIGAIILVVILIVKEYFKPSAPPVVLPPIEKKPRPPLRAFTREELKKYNGDTPETPIYVCIRGKVYDVTRGRDFYGSDGAYHVFAGRDATRALAKQSVELEDVENYSTENLNAGEKDTLEEWISMFEFKYDVVGFISEASPQSNEVEERLAE